MLSLDPNGKLELNEQDSVIPNSTLTSMKTILELSTRAYVYSSNENSGNRRDLSTVFNDEDTEIDINKKTNLDSFTVNRFDSSDNELANKKNFDDELVKNAILRFN